MPNVAMCGSLSDVETPPLAYRSLHLKIDESLQFDAIFHRKLAYQIVHKSIDRQTHRLTLAQSALLHIENLLSMI